MKITKSQLRQIIREEIQKESNSGIIGTSRTALDKRMGELGVNKLSHDDLQKLVTFFLNRQTPEDRENLRLAISHTSKPWGQNK